MKFGTGGGYSAGKETDAKFADKFGGEEQDWGGRVKLKNSKKPDQPAEEAPAKQPVKEKEPEDKQTKPSRYVDSNNKFSILKTDS